MHLIKNITVIIILLLLTGCIKPYDPVIDANAENKYVVSGRITDQEGFQEVAVSLSSPIKEPKSIPVGFCQVNILDDKGNVFALEEYQPGQYRVWIDQANLAAGTSYKVKVITPTGETLESGFDKMPKCPPIDTVYYFVEDVPTTDPTVTSKVMQFYVDLDAIGDYSQYYKWDIMETWEYHAAHPAQYYYDGTFHEIIPPDYSNNVCYTNNLVKNVFTISTKGLSQNTYKQYPLHSIDGQTQRLAYLYSILVSQVALTEQAYNYWEQLRINSNEQGGLYEKQPLAIKGNLLNLSTPEKDVLGCFYASSVSTRRYFFQHVQGIDMSFNNFCSEDPLGKFAWKEFSPDEYPVFYYFNESGYLRILGTYCIDCRKMGGTTVKPDFWPN